MRNKLLSFLLISSFLIGSLPATFAQEVPLPPTETTETPASIEEAPIEIPVVTETPPVVEEETPAPEASIQTPDTQVTDTTLESNSVSSFVIDESASSTIQEYTEVEGTITLPNGCTAKDVDEGLHVYPKATSSPAYLAICALVEAEEDGLISGFEFKDFGWGLMITSIDGIAPGENEFWELFKNGASSFEGVQSLELASGDTITFVRTNYVTPEEEVLNQITIHIGAVVETYHNVIVPNQCTATATNGTVYTFPEDASDDEHLAICALVAAEEDGMISDFAFDYFQGAGAFISSIDGTASAGNIFWAMWLNTQMAEVGAADLEVAVGDVVSFRYSDATSNWPPVELDERHDLRVIGFSNTEIGTSTDETGGGSGNGVGDGDVHGGDDFDISAAFNFLATEQDEDGSWDSELVTDWAAFALAVSGAPEGMESALGSYLRKEEPDLDSVLDYERHAMALMALNINPYTGGPSDYITPIVESFDGTQIDDDGLVNDDIFALIPLLHAGYDKDDEMIQKITTFIVSEQKSNGSWENSIDVTAAAIQALSGVRSLSGVSGALSGGETFLQSSQKSDGGFGDPFATSWAIQGIEALGQSTESWTVGEYNPLTYLASEQGEDGGLSTNPDDYSTRAWATAYAIPAAKGLTWDDILRDFKQQEEDSDDNDGSSNEDEKTNSDTATTTDDTLPIPEVEILVMEPLAASSSSPVQNYEVLDVVEDPYEPVVEDMEEAPEEISGPNMRQPAAVGSTGAGAWLKKFLLSLWSSIAGLFS